MDMKGVETWIEANPGKSVLIGGGLLILILWLLGYFSSSTASTDNTQSSLAAAYYAAEAQQAVVGGQIQMANINATASTAQAGINANAAVAINAANGNAAQIINGQNASAATTINQAQVTGATTINTALGTDALLATQSNNDAFVSANATNAATAQAIDASNNQATILQSAFNTWFPTELQTLGGITSGIEIPGAGIGGGPSKIVAWGGTPTPDTLASWGFSNQYITGMGGAAGLGAPP